MGGEKRDSANEKRGVKRDKGQDEVGWGIIQNLNMVVAASDMVNNVEIILLWSTREEIFVLIPFIDNSTTNERFYSNRWSIAIVRHHCESKSLVIYFGLSKLYNSLKLATLSTSSELGATSKLHNGLKLTTLLISNKLGATNKLCSCLKLITMSRYQQASLSNWASNCLNLTSCLW